MQSRSMSWAEAVANTAVGYAVAVVTTAIVLPMFGISAIFTVVSLIRSYVLRRAFNTMGQGHGRSQRT